MGTFYTWGEQLSYYPEQALMDAHSSSTKNWGWTVAGGGYEVSCQGLPNQLASLPVLYYLTSSVVVKAVELSFTRLLRNSMSLADHRGTQRGRLGAYYIYCVSQHRESTDSHQPTSKLLMRNRPKYYTSCSLILYCTTYLLF